MGFVPGLKDGTRYKFFVVGLGSTGFKRDLWARVIVPVPGLPTNCVVRDPNTFPWHDQGFSPPAFNDLIIYQFHIGNTIFGRDAKGNDDRRGRDCTFLDVIDRIEYLVELGVNTIEPLPIIEFETETSQGYNGSDLFAPGSTGTRCCRATRGSPASSRRSTGGRGIGEAPTPGRRA